MHRLSMVLILAIVVAAFPALAAPTYGERLGWGPNDRVLIIHSDDVGMSHANNEGSIEALEYGLVTSVSVMMPCSWVSGWLPYVKQNPNVDMGLHLTLTSEYDFYRWGPLAGKNQVPGLADEHGCLPDNVGLVEKNATADEVELEIRAQIDRARTMGLPITHLDSHMGTLFRPKFIERYAKVGIEKQIPVLMVPEAGPVAEMVWKGGLPVIDHIHTNSYNWKTLDIDEKVGLFVDSIRKLKPGITEMIIHCTKPNDMIGLINGNRDFLYGDYYAMIDPRTKKAIEEEGIILTTWRELKERRDQVKQ
jgi:hypothetical protein